MKQPQSRRKPRAWTDIGLRFFCCALLFATGYQLLIDSAFGYRMRNDYPVTAFAIALSGGLSIVPLIAWKKYLRAFLVSAFALTAIGAYWWTGLPWDRFLTNSQFPAPTPPGALDYLLVLSPALIAAFYAVASRYSVMRADWLRRGADRDEASRAAAGSFLAGVAAMFLAVSLTFALVALFISGALLRGAPQLPRGVPAIVAAGALVTIAVVLARTTRARVHLPGPATARAPAAPAADAAPTGGPTRKRMWRRAPG